MTSRPAGQAGLALLAVACTLLPLSCGSDDQSAEGALVTEPRPRASGIQLRPDERLLWGNLVVHAAGDQPVELRDVELLRADDGLRVRRLLVADGRRPQDACWSSASAPFALSRTPSAGARASNPCAATASSRWRARGSRASRAFSPVAGAGA